MDFSHQSTL